MAVGGMAANKGIFPWNEQEGDQQANMHHRFHAQQE
jgi:hypothetical protein